MEKFADQKYCSRREYPKRSSKVVYLNSSSSSPSPSPPRYYGFENKAERQWMERRYVAEKEKKKRRREEEQRKIEAQKCIDEQRKREDQNKKVDGTKPDPFVASRKIKKKLNL